MACRESILILRAETGIFLSIKAISPVHENPIWAMSGESHPIVISPENQQIHPAGSPVKIGADQGLLASPWPKAGVNVGWETLAGAPFRTLILEESKATNKNRRE